MTAQYRQTGEIYHLVTETAFRSQVRGDIYRPASFGQEGFIHCAGEPDTLLKVANDYFASVEEPVLVLTINIAQVQPEVKFEPPAPLLGGGTSHLQGGLLFPHIYGPLNLEAITSLGVLQKSAEGYAWPTHFVALSRFLEERQKIATAALARCGLTVPVMVLGTGPLGHLYRPISETQAVETIQTALEQGIFMFDTAPSYGGGVSEQYLGRALAGVERNRFILATKTGKYTDPDRGATIFDYSREGVLRCLEQSLERLQVDRVDIIHIHDADNHYAPALDQAFPTLAELRSQGVIRAIGAGMNQWQMLAGFARNADFDCFLLAGRYTLLEQGALSFLNLCQDRNIGLFLAGVYNSGILATGARPGARYNYQEAPPEVLERVRRIEQVCHRHNVALNVAALQFARTHPAVTALIVGAESPVEVMANLQALQSPIPGELWAGLRQAGLLDPEAPLPAEKM